jgi:hypothetical protein
VGVQDLVLRGMDAAVTALLRPQQAAIHQLRTIVGRGPNAARMAAALHLLDRSVPGTASGLSRALLDPSRLPVPANGADLIAFGSGATVFRLECQGFTLALKVYRRTLGMPLAQQREILAEYRRKHRMATRLYNAAGPIVPPAAFLLLHGPLLRRRAGAVLQPFLGGARRDFLGDLSEAEQLEILREDETLRAQFGLFAERTIAAFGEGGECLDLLGRDNLMLVTEGRKRRLAVADFGFFDLAALACDAPDKLRRMGEVVDRLAALHAHVQERRPAAGRR